MTIFPEVFENVEGVEKRQRRMNDCLGNETPLLLDPHDLDLDCQKPVLTRPAKSYVIYGADLFLIRFSRRLGARFSR